MAAIARRLHCARLPCCAGLPKPCVSRRELSLHAQRSVLRSGEAAAAGATKKDAGAALGGAGAASGASGAKKESKGRVPVEPLITGDVVSPDLPPSKTVIELVDKVMSLSLQDSLMFLKTLQQRVGVTEEQLGNLFSRAAATVPAPEGGLGASAGAPGGEAAAKGEKKEEKKEAPAAEKTSFSVKLESFDEKKKINLIKEVRTLTGLGLKQAKDLVEGAPCIIKPDLNKKEAEELAAKIKEAGGTVSII
jgi:large subunit ribosomal protein L7/L12